MNGEVVLDTSVVVAHFRNDKIVVQNLEEVDALYLPVTVIGELHYGACRAADSEKAITKLATFLAIVGVLPCDEETAQVYGRVKAELARRGTPIPENDIWIAASAIQNMLPLAARDPHFKEIDGLNLLEW